MESKDTRLRHLVFLSIVCIPSCALVLVQLTDEFRTTIFCPTCNEKLRLPKHPRRALLCTRCRIIWYRDLSAPINIARKGAITKNLYLRILFQNIPFFVEVTINRYRALLIFHHLFFNIKILFKFYYLHTIYFSVSAQFFFKYNTRIYDLMVVNFAVWPMAVGADPGYPTKILISL